MLYCFSAWLIFLRRRWCPFEKDSSWWVAETRYMFNCLIIIHYLLFRCRLKFSFCVDFELFKVSHLRQPYRYCNLAYRLISLWGLFEILCEIFFFFRRDMPCSTKRAFTHAHLHARLNRVEYYFYFFYLSTHYCHELIVLDVSRTHGTFRTYLFVT